MTDWTLYEGELVTVPTNCARDNWAPEVHAYRGAYYMFTTYQSAVTGRHGCTVLRADSPLGPFVEITDGTVTPARPETPVFVAIREKNGALICEADG